MGLSLDPVGFDDLPGWHSDDPREAIAALFRSHDHLQSAKPYRSGALGLSAAELKEAIGALRVDVENGGATISPATARAIVARHFLPFRVIAEPAGFVTAFYEPEIEVRATPDSIYRFPFLRRPDDLVDVDDANRPAGLDPALAFARRTADGLEPFFDRQTIDGGALDGRGLEIAYAADKVDVFFAHVQGAARLVFPEGRQLRITYAAKSGHPFSPIGRLLIERGDIDPARISMRAIRDWLARHPDAVDGVLWHNRSYIFFREAAVTDPALGPIAAAKVPLTPGRSLAVDRLIHTFATPFFIDAPTLRHLDGGEPFRRLMVAQDTGSAIVGPARGDIFTGSGAAAGDRAGSVRHPAAFYVLIPQAVAWRYRP